MELDHLEDSYSFNSNHHKTKVLQYFATFYCVAGIFLDWSSPNRRPYLLWFVVIGNWWTGALYIALFRMFFESHVDKYGGNYNVGTYALVVRTGQ